MGHPLDGARLRLERADRHLAEADNLIRRFSKDCEQYIVIHDNRDLRLDGWPDLPVELPLAISDAVHNLRASLDYVVYELALYDSGKPQSGTQFLIEDHKVDPTNPNRGFDARRKKCLRGLNRGHVEMVEDLQPYKGAEWTRTLRDISNPDKHRHLTVLSTFQRLAQAVMTANPNGKYLLWAPDSELGGEALSRFNVELNADQSIAIAPAQPDSPGVMPTLRRLEADVSRTIAGFMPEFK